MEGGWTGVVGYVPHPKSSRCRRDIVGNLLVNYLFETSARWEAGWTGVVGDVPHPKSSRCRRDIVGNLLVNYL